MCCHVFLEVRSFGLAWCSFAIPCLASKDFQSNHEAGRGLLQAVRPLPFVEAVPQLGALIPFVSLGGGFPYSNRLPKKGYPYSNLSTGGPSYCGICPERIFVTRRTTRWRSPFIVTSRHAVTWSRAANTLKALFFGTRG